MSDNFKIIGIGGAGVNVLKGLNYRNSLFIDSRSYPNVQDVVRAVNSTEQTTKTIIVTSPAGDFSGSVLPSVCNTLHSKREEIVLISILPFLGESPERKIRGQKIIRDVRGLVDSSVLVDNENFASNMLDRSWSEAIENINGYVGRLVEDFISVCRTAPQEENVKSLTNFNPGYLQQA